eukprot:TRINITY_DN4258_c0_g1_i1.p1 TRINITY_DN4258_c0_g1~~TRINITY_DN4258_c0_g1_i1.p1  ORF type:complete len:129 (+),score=28.31 TRINITY_DN4258_c0_g1_i1:93-479(+)
MNASLIDDSGSRSESAANMTVNLQRLQFLKEEERPREYPMEDFTRNENQPTNEDRGFTGLKLTGRNERPREERRTDDLSFAIDDKGSLSTLKKKNSKTIEEDNNDETVSHVLKPLGVNSVNNVDLNSA